MQVRQRREILGKQIGGARRPQSFGSPSASPPPPPPSDSIRGSGLSPGSSPAASASTSVSGSARRTLFDSGAARPEASAPSVQQAQPEGPIPYTLAAGLPDAELRDSTTSREGPQGTAAERRMLGDGRLEDSAPETSGVGRGPAVANGPASLQGSALAAPAAATPRRRPWLTQPAQ